MGFTIADMLLFTKDKYNMEMVAGRNGWANSISWLLMVEDTTITRNFKGKELVVTTGLGFETTEKLLELIKILDDHHSAGLIINTGFYIHEIPEEVLQAADACDLPLMTVPWSVLMSEMIKDLTVRIFLQSQTDEQITLEFIKALERPDLSEEFREALSTDFDVDGEFQVVVFKTEDLDSMDSMERRRIGYRLQIYLENISHNGHFFYHNGSFVLIFNSVDEKSRKEIIEGFLDRVGRRMMEKQVYVGIGSLIVDVTMLHVSYERALFAVELAMNRKTSMQRFDDLSKERLLYSVSDQLIVSDIQNQILKPLISYDEKHQSDLLETFQSYLKNSGSISKVSEELFIHKNTILYRMNKIKELLNSSLEDGEERLYYYIALVLYQLKKNQRNSENN